MNALQKAWTGDKINSDIFDRRPQYQYSVKTVGMTFGTFTKDDTVWHHENDFIS